MATLYGGNKAGLTIAWRSPMSDPLVVKIPHKLGKEEAMKPALRKASSSFPMLAVEEETWLGDRLSFRVHPLGQAASGNVEVAEDHVHLEMTLPCCCTNLRRQCKRPSPDAAGCCSRRNDGIARSRGPPPWGHPNTPTQDQCCSHWSILQRCDRRRTMRPELGFYEL